jgi:hypothetical protein
MELNQTGDWQARFLASNGVESIGVNVTIRVFAGPGAGPAAPVANPPNAAATATIFAQNVAQARITPAPGMSPLPIPQPASPLALGGQAAMRSPLAANTSPLVVSAGRASTSRPANPFGSNWWLWGILGIVPVLALFAWALRPNPEDES